MLKKDRGLQTVVRDLNGMKNLSIELNFYKTKIRTEKHKSLVFSIFLFTIHPPRFFMKSSAAALRQTLRQPLKTPTFFLRSKLD